LFLPRLLQSDDVGTEVKPLDPRLNACRADLADVALKGKVQATRFVAGEPMRVIGSVAPLRRAPATDAPLDTEALRGELVSVFETNDDGWSWAQLAEDRYVGWIPHAALGPAAPEPTHKVSALRTFAFSNSDIKSVPLDALPLGARVSVTGAAEDRNARYALIAPNGAVVRQHLATLDEFQEDWTSVAERFLGVPYLWGGKTSLGIDCSGLVQVALGACGIRAPRDSDMQAGGVGELLATGEGIPRLQRGDLVFWSGHVGIMRDAESMVHASGYHMEVVSEPLAEAIRRFSARAIELVAIRRPVAD
jgi:cell wall-associated NlpC family hydrolase